MEVCVDCVSSALNAERGGAIRIELCANLPEGGTTPSIGTVQVIKQKLNIPVFVMIRPRGADFVYDEDDFEIMKQDILAFKSVGVDGFVFGILRMDGSVDAERCQELLELIRPQPATFHRAIDVSNNIEKALEAVISLRFERILSSGGENSALEGLPMLEKMIKQAAGRITIMPESLDTYISTRCSALQGRAIHRNGSLILVNRTSAMRKGLDLWVFLVEASMREIWKEFLKGVKQKNFMVLPDPQ